MFWVPLDELRRDIVLQRVVSSLNREIQKSAVAFLIVAVTVDSRLEQTLVLVRRYLKLVWNLLRSFIYHHVALLSHARCCL